mgnify:CR=1 FL=1
MVGGHGSPTRPGVPYYGQWCNWKLTQRAQHTPTQVKTQRALNDYRKSEYPHYKDELTKLKHIGSITAQRLREIQSHLDCPYSSIETGKDDGAEAVARLVLPITIAR